MRLSEAIRLGSLAIQNPKKTDIRTCAIGMACEAIGQQKNGDGNYIVLGHQWPWTGIFVQGHFDRWDHAADGVWSLFDNRVATHEPTMNIDQLCDVVAKWEAEFIGQGVNVEQVTMIATPETTHEPAAEHARVLEPELKGVS